MRTTVSVLVTSAGGAAAINVMQALMAQEDIPVRLVAVDMDPLAPGLYLADAKYVVPRATDDRFIPELLRICRAERVKVVIPMLSVEVPVIAAHRKEFDELGILMLASSEDTTCVCADKRLTHRFFVDHGIPIPETWTGDTIPQPGTLPYPVIVKPAVSSGSRHAYRVDNARQFSGFKSLVPYPIVQPFVDGTEITVDVLADNESNTLAGVQRERMRVSDGKAITARTLWDDEVDSYVRRIVKAVKLTGPGNIQCIKTDDGLFFIEINARFAAGGLPLTVAAGANTPLMLLKVALGIPVAPIADYRTGLVMSRYLTEIFIEQGSIGNYRLVRA